MIQCEFCSSKLKSDTNLKLHLVSSKKCLKIRGLKLETKFVCKGCKKNFMNNVNLGIHCESCKEYLMLEINEEKNKLLDIIKNKDLIINEYKEQHEKDLDKLQMKVSECDFLIKKISKLQIADNKTKFFLKELIYS